MTFWLIACALAAAVAAVLARPLLKRQSVPAGADHADAIYRGQLGEVGRDLERGLISGTEAEALRTEIQRRLLAADARRRQSGCRKAKALPSGWPAAAALMLALGGGSVATYSVVGSPALVGRPHPQPAAVAAMPAAMGDPTERAAALRARLEADPGQAEGWMMLGRTYRALKRYREAADAFDRAVAVSGRAPEALSAWGDALVLAGEGAVAATAREAFREALEKDPYDGPSRYYLGLALLQGGDAAGALQAWTDLVALAAPNTPWLGRVKDQIVQVAQRVGVDLATLRPSAGLPPRAGMGR